MRHAVAAICAELGTARATDEQLAFCHHIAALAVVEPRITIYWIKPGSHHARIVGPGNAAAWSGRRAVMTQALSDEPRLAFALHEIGHVRRPRKRQVESELAAWQFAVELAPIWTESMDAAMRRGLVSYLTNAADADCIDTFLAEDFLETARRTHTQLPSRSDLLAREYFLEFGVPDCQGAHRTEVAAVCLYAGRHLCLDCHIDAVRADRKREAERKAARQKADRERAAEFSAKLARERARRDRESTEALFAAIRRGASLREATAIAERYL